MANTTSQLLMGIDLGTSRTAVATNRGYKNMVSSAVGYPKDLIALKLLGKSLVIGDEAISKRSFLDVYFPLEDGVVKETSEKDLEAAKELLKHVVALASAGGGAAELCGIIGVPARASISSKEILLKMASEIFSTAIVISEPFMVAYGISKLTNSIIVDMGAGTIDICGMKGTVPSDDDQATIMKGGNYIDSALATAIQESYPNVQITPHLARTLKEKHAFVGDPKGKIEVQLRADGKPVICDITTEVRFACESVVPDMVEKIGELASRFDPEAQPEALKNIILAGGCSQIHGLAGLLTARLAEYGDIGVSIVNDPDYCGCDGALKLANDLPPSYWDQVGEMLGV